MRATSKLLALALTAALQPAMAGVVSLNFEDLTQTAKLGAYDGVTFSGDAWGVTSKSTANKCSGAAAFLRAGSCGALELALDATGDATTDTQAFVLNLAGGFVTQFSFFYSALPGAGVTIQLFDGANGTGNELQSLSNLTEAGCGLNGFVFCNWSQSTVQFAGTALSLKVSGADQSLMLDDFQFTTPTSGGGTVPEPASIALALGALGAAAWTRRRAAR